MSFFTTSKIEAASLYLSPASSSVSVGNIFSIKVMVNTSGKVINNAEANIQFPTDMLEVVSVTKSSSVFSLWVEEPSFSNYTGNIVFNGGVPNPGFNGSNGYISTITFKAKKPGTASVLFSDGAVRENDGLGTDILTSKISSNIQIVSPVVAPVVTTTPAVVKTDVPVDTKDKSNVLPKPVIVSDTHPDQDLWYSNRTASFSWKIPSGVTSLKTLVNNKTDSTPTISYDNSVTQKTLDNLSDGTFYFHLQYFNSSAKSLVAHYRFKIDGTNPLPFTPLIKTEDSVSVISLNAEDKLSGIDHYLIKIDNSTEIKVNKIDIYDGKYTLPVLSEGGHNINVIAYDKASNYTEAVLTFISPRISSPELSLSSNEITKGEAITILGKTNYPNSEVEVKMTGKKNSLLCSIFNCTSSDEVKTYKQKTDQNGDFSIVTDPVNTSGTIGVSSYVVFGDSIKSDQSEAIYLNVKDTKIVSTTLSMIPPMLNIIILSLLFVTLIIILYVGWHKFFGLKKKFNRELQGTATEVHKAMLLLKEELNNQLEILEKVKVDRSLNKKEEAIFAEIESNIDDIDNFIKKKLNKIL